MKPFARGWETIVFVLMMLILISGIGTALWVLLVILERGLA